jgi:hypothetical protein
MEAKYFTATLVSAHKTTRLHDSDHNICDYFLKQHLPNSLRYKLKKKLSTVIGAEHTKGAVIPTDTRTRWNIVTKWPDIVSKTDEEYPC